MKITVVEPFRSLFYAPQFVALHLGYFADEDLDVTVRTGIDATSTTRALIDGSATFAMGGIMRSLDLADRGGRFLPHFAEVNSRNGFFLLAREPRPNFAWSDVAGRTVISFAGAPTPWQCMLTVLRRHGVDPSRVTFVRTLHGEDAARALREGRGDFLEAGQPMVEQLLMAGAAHLVASMGDATGPVPFSSYMTTPDRLRRQSELCERFTRAVHRAQRFIAASDGKAIADAVAPSFPDIDPEVRVRAVERYRRQSTWASDPVCRQPGYEYLVDILLSGGFIRRRHRYADLVDTEIARRVVAATTRAVTA